MPSAAIRNITSAGWLTAQADRLKRFIATLQRFPSSFRDPRSANYDARSRIRESISPHVPAAPWIPGLRLTAHPGMTTELERQRRHHSHLLGGIEFLHAERDDLRALLHSV